MTTTAEAQALSWQPSPLVIEKARLLRDQRDASIGGHRPRFSATDEATNDTRWIGEIFEFFIKDEALRRGIIYSYQGGKGQPDFVFGRYTIDCKAGVGRGRPREDYRIEASADEADSPVDIHLFGHWTPEERRIYIVGAVSHQRLFNAGTFYGCGTKIGPFRVKDRRGIYSLPIIQLLSPEKFFKFLKEKT